MGTIPTRSKLAGIYRKILSTWEKGLVLPIRNPSFYQVVAIFLSILLMFLGYKPVVVVLVFLILLSDWFDGAVARSQGVASLKGWMIDVVVDRISEGFMFIPLLDTFVGKLFFFSYLVNIGFSFYSVKTGKHILLPLRFVYLVYLIVSLPFGLWL